MTTIFDEPNGKDGMPWQIKAIGLIGVPSAIAIYWTVVAAQDIRLNQQAQKENLALHATQTSVVSEQNRELLVTLEELKRSMSKICTNTAKNYQERNDCFR